MLGRLKGKRIQKSETQQLSISLLVKESLFVQKHFFRFENPFLEKYFSLETFEASRVTRFCHFVKISASFQIYLSLGDLLLTNFYAIEQILISL